MEVFDVKVLSPKFGYIFTQTLFLFSLRLASFWVIFIDELRYINVVVLLAETYLNMFSLTVPMKLSITQDFSSFFCRIELNYILSVFIIEFATSIYPYFICSSLFQDPRKCVCRCPVFHFKGIIRTNLENMPITANKYLISLMHFENACMSIKSAAQISSIPFTLTLLLWHFLVTGLQSSSASSSSSFRIFFDFYRSTKTKINYSINEISNYLFINSFP